MKMESSFIPFISITCYRFYVGEFFPTRNAHPYILNPLNRLVSFDKFPSASDANRTTPPRMTLNTILHGGIGYAEYQHVLIEYNTL